jgi:hypothetical protein
MAVYPTLRDLSSVKGFFVRLDGDEGVAAGEEAEPKTSSLPCSLLKCNEAARFTASSKRSTYGFRK